MEIGIKLIINWSYAPFFFAKKISMKWRTDYVNSRSELCLIKRHNVRTAGIYKTLTYYDLSLCIQVERCITTYIVNMYTTYVK